MHINLRSHKRHVTNPIAGSGNGFYYRCGTPTGTRHQREQRAKRAFLPRLMNTQK